MNKKNKKSILIIPIIICIFFIGIIPLINFSIKDVNENQFLRTSSTTQYIDSITYVKGVAGGGNLENTQTNDTNYQQINAHEKWYGGPIQDYVYTIDIYFNIDPIYNGSDFILSCHIENSAGMSLSLRVNGDLKASGTGIEFAGMDLYDVNSIRLEGKRWSTDFNSRIYFFELIRQD